MQARLVGAAALLAAAVTPAQVFVVDDDGGPGVDYTDLPAAIAAVPSGSVLRVRPGDYTHFALAGKSLTIVGDDRDTVRVALYEGDPIAPTRVTTTIGPTAPGEVVVLSDLTMAGNVGFPPILTYPVTAHRVQDTMGRVVMTRVSTDYLEVERADDVHLLDVAIEGSPPFFQYLRQYGHSLHLIDSNVELAHSTVRGQDGIIRGGFEPAENAGDDGIKAESSRLVLVATDVRGGEGGVSQGAWFQGFDGGHAIELESCSTLIAMDSTLVGGNAFVFDPRWLATAGSGIEASADSTARVEGSIPQAGVVGPYTIATPPWIGPVTVNQDSTPAIGRLLGRQAKGTPLTFSLEAAPGSVAYLHFSFTTQHLPLEPELAGSLFVVPQTVLPLGVVPPSGRLSLRVTIPSWWPTDVPLYSQWTTAEPSGAGWASNSMLLLVPSGRDAVEALHWPLTGEH